MADAGAAAERPEVGRDPESARLLQLLPSGEQGPEEAFPPSARWHQRRCSPKWALSTSVAALAAAAVLCFALKTSARTNLAEGLGSSKAQLRYETPTSLDVAATSEARLHVCRNTESWSDGYSLCNSNGYRGPGCTLAGYSCEAYAANGWCYMGQVMRADMSGFGSNYPEQNCCVCGGGSENRQGRPEPAAGYSHQTCEVHKACVAVNLKGLCCPTSDGDMLDCCDSEPVCEDDHVWTDGYTRCRQDGLAEAQGCTGGGMTCEGYVNQSYCKDGSILPAGKQFEGSGFNYPEVHCCACGRGTPKVSGKTVWLNALRDKAADDRTVTQSELQSAAASAAEGALRTAEAAQAGLEEAAASMRHSLPSII